MDMGRSFQHALRVRSETMKEQQKRRQKFSSSWAPGVKMDTPLFKGFTNSNSQNKPRNSKEMPTAPRWQPPLEAHTNEEVSTGNLRRRGNMSTGMHGKLNKRHWKWGTNIPRLLNILLCCADSMPQYTPTTSSGEGAAAPRLNDSNEFPSDQYSVQQLANYHDAQKRANDAAQVESTISELGQMFTRMANLVVEQGETIERIDQDTSVA